MRLPSGTHRASSRGLALLPPPLGSLGNCQENPRGSAGDDACHALPFVSRRDSARQRGERDGNIPRRSRPISMHLTSNRSEVPTGGHEQRSDSQETAVSHAPFPKKCAARMCSDREDGYLSWPFPSPRKGERCCRWSTTFAYGHIPPTGRNPGVQHESPPANHLCVPRGL